MQTCEPWRSSAWDADPVLSETGETLAFKYSGYCLPTSARIRREYQIVCALTDLFWEVKHASIYKPEPRLMAAVRSLEMQRRYQGVLRELGAFEEEFERLLRENPSREV